VLGRLIALEPRQADLLERICGNLSLSADELRTAGALAQSEESAVPAKRKRKSEP